MFEMQRVLHAKNRVSCGFYLLPKYLLLCSSQLCTSVQVRSWSLARKVELLDKAKWRRAIKRKTCFVVVVKLPKTRK